MNSYCDEPGTGLNAYSGDFLTYILTENTLLAYLGYIALYLTLLGFMSIIGG